MQAFYIVLGVVSLVLFTFGLVFSLRGSGPSRRLFAMFFVGQWIVAACHIALMVMQGNLMRVGDSADWLVAAYQVLSIFTMICYICLVLAVQQTFSTRQRLLESYEARICPRCGHPARRSDAACIECGSQLAS